MEYRPFIRLQREVQHLYSFSEKRITECLEGNKWIARENKDKTITFIMGITNSWSAYRPKTWMRKFTVSLLERTQTLRCFPRTFHSPSTIGYGNNIVIIVVDENCRWRDDSASLWFRFPSNMKPTRLKISATPKYKEFKTVRWEFSGTKKACFFRLCTPIIKFFSYTFVRFLLVLISVYWCIPREKCELQQSGTENNL